MVGICRLYDTGENLHNIEPLFYILYFWS